MDRKNMKYMSSNLERSVETDMNAIAARNKDALNAALIQPLSPEWQFCTNGLNTRNSWMWQESFHHQAYPDE